MGKTKICGPALRRATVGPVAEKTIELDRLEEVKVVTRFPWVNLRKDHYQPNALQLQTYSVQRTTNRSAGPRSRQCWLTVTILATGYLSQSVVRSLPRGGSSWVARFKGIIVGDGRPVASPLGAFSSSLIHTIVIATPVSLGAFVVALLFIPVVRSEAGTDTSLSL